MKSVIDEELQFAELYIRQSQPKRAHELSMLLLKNLKDLKPREQIKLGNVFRRCGDYTRTLKLLHPLARRDVLLSETKYLAQLEYAAALVQLGLTTEANEMLSQLDYKVFPEALMHQSLSLFQEWNYEAAIPFLNKFIQSSGIDEYRRLVGKLNLFVAYAFARPELLSWKDIEETGQYIQSQNYFFLMGVWSQVKGRYLMLQKDFAGATQVFSQGLSQIKEVSTLDALYLQKWNLVCTVQKSGPNKKNRKDFEDLKNLAKVKGDFETVRDCDFLISQYFQESKIGQYCFHGTPFDSFRARFIKGVNFDNSDVSFFITEDGTQWRRPNVKFTKVKSLSLEKVVSAFEAHDGKKLVEGNLIDRTFKAILSDFYRPMTTQRLFETLYKGNHWNPHTSPLQIRQALFRLRQWLRNNKIPLLISEKNNSYYLVSEKKNSLTIYMVNAAYTNSSLPERLLEEFQDRLFSFKDFQILANKNAIQSVSLRTHRRWIRNLLANQRIVKIGNTKSTRFKNKINT